MSGDDDYSQDEMHSPPEEPQKEKTDNYSSDESDNDVRFLDINDLKNRRKNDSESDSA